MPSFKTSFIREEQRRNIAFCKKKKDLLKRSIDMSVQCDISVMLVIYDQHKKRMTYYTSSEDFNMLNAFEAKKEAKLPKNVHKFERFTNADFDAVKKLDFRSVRY